MTTGVDLGETLGVTFLGFVIGAILFGITALQTYQYFSNYWNDPISKKLAVASLGLLDLLHLIFSIHMMYFYLIKNFGDTDAINQPIWSLKAVGTTHVLVVWLVQSLYLIRIWKFSKSLFLSRRWESVLLVGCIGTGLLALGVGLLFIIEINSNRLVDVISFAGFEWVIYSGFSVSALIDGAIAAVMFLLLHRSITGYGRMDDVAYALIQYVVSTGLLTTLAAITYIILYAVRPKSLLYLGMEFSITRLYTNSFLAMCNARNWLRSLDKRVDINTSALHFNGDLEKTASDQHSGDEGRAEALSPPATWSGSTAISFDLLERRNIAMQCGAGNEVLV